MESRQVGAEFFNADGRRERHDEANSRFLQICENPVEIFKVFYLCLQEIIIQFKYLNSHER
jgi:hypothetical protein